MVVILLIGSGGREHALAYKLAQSASVQHVFVVPGNAGTALINTKVSNVNIDTSHFDHLVQFGKANDVQLAVVGPEQPLVDGISEAFKAAGIACFGPSKRASQIEGSKAFSKAFMERHKIPTATYKVFKDLNEAIAFVQGSKQKLVIKASGLAAGKGVLLPETVEEGVAALNTIMSERAFGSAGDEVVIEEFLEGEELSVLAFCDGYTVVPLPAAQDHKRAFDGDQGPNTGGMGAYAPAPLGTPTLMKTIYNRVLKPTVDGLRREGMPYVGILYAGLMISPSGDINVLEFNCRFGDPETQVLIPLLADDCDLAQILLACCEGRLDSVTVSFRPGFAATVVAASPGYPGSYQKGSPITINSHANGANRHVYIAGGNLTGPVLHNGSSEVPSIITSGGRVLSVTGLGDSLQLALNEAYAGIREVSFSGMHFRKDIGHRAVARLHSASTAEITYAQAGVDIAAGDEFVERIKPLAKSTSRVGCDSALGGFGGLFDLKAAGYKDAILVSGTDGVGTKLRVAQLIGIHNTIGIDLVAMCVNDLVVQGAEPLFFLDYFATSRLILDTAVHVVEGIAQGCRESGCALVGGETAEMPGMYSDDDYDLAGFAVGAVEREQVLPVPCSVGDVVIGLPSSGVHSNGYSLVRHLVKLHELDYHGKPPFESSKRTLGEALLIPTRLYVNPCVPLAKQGLVKGMAHITGGGLLENIPRMLTDDLGVELDAATWPFLPVFAWLAKLGNISHDELARTFNCGIGMVLVISPTNVASVAQYLNAHNEPFYQIGTVVKRSSPTAHQVHIGNTKTAWIRN